LQERRGATFTSFPLFNTTIPHATPHENHLPALATPCVLLTTSRPIPLSSSAL
jgi:hypothetical protein